ncbi:PREDICTED: uncharacterized protein LOC109208132 [Nicotiana attenuata]|uniref:uncharacterized protein LOC109208132 n=1 Tax=Nicotiana attenuata TaxID=49451 RepID=UPI0009055F27|nr:PREDICTED: uncharacterized protein LOC109208132 [Nicotiana attenuata]
MPETSPMSEEQKEDSEADSDDLPIASLPRRRLDVDEEPTPTRPTTRLQKKKALESALKNSQAKSRRRKLMKHDKVINEKIMPVVNVDKEEAEEPSTLTRKLSQNHDLLKPKGGSSVSAKSLTKSDDAVATKNVLKELGEKSVKSDKKEKSVRKTAKRKADTDKEPGSSKTARVGDLGSAGKERLRSQKVLWGCTFASDVLEEARIRQLVEIYEFQQWKHLFIGDAARVEDDHICALVNGVDMVMDSSLLGSILSVPAEGVSSVQGACTQNFRNAILKDTSVQQGERVQNKALLPIYQLLFEMVNKVLLRRAERRSITSRADLFLMEALDDCTTINLPRIMIEHMNKVAGFKDGNHGLPYGFLLTKVFEHFKVPLGPVKVGAKKQTFSKVTLEECECIEKFGGTQLSQLQEAPGSSSSQSEEVARLTKKNAELRKQVEDLKGRLLNEQMSANARTDLVLQTISSASKPSPSSAP